MFLAGERSNHNFPDFRTQGVFKCTANIYGGSAKNVINQNYLTVRHFSANGIELPLGEVEMKIFKRSAHAALPLARTYRSLAVRSARHTWRAC